ncbi:hypothetical protein C6Y14_22530 [Streptomyces dioscori]|uniref:WD40 repeat domain-containing protein n=1 Tax=Streptomyces dioscori TaxID=2109333 RepID=A0A2P8Q4L2_9ACTN|nr:WD40 repeat domain-containing protein [Streptomyces dioscori]PSM41184.1 hypothetical protein C6Y14_22530 [Streptomyces dioscori]
MVGLASDLSVEQPLARHSNSVADIAMNADGSVVLSTSDVGDAVQSSLTQEAKLADVPAGIRSREAQTDLPYTSLTASSDGRWLLVRQFGGFRIIDKRSRAGSLNSGPSTVSAVWADGRRVLSTSSSLPETAVNGRYFAVATPSGTDTDGPESDMTVTVWRCDGSRAPKVLWRTRTNGGLSRLAVSDDGEYLVLGDSEDKGEIVRRSTPDRHQPLAGGNTVSGMSEYVVAREQGLVVQHTDSVRQGADETDSHNQLLLWDLATGRLIGSWKEPIASVLRGQLTDLALVEAGRRVATIRPDGNLGLWNISPADWRKDLCRLAGGEPTDAQRALYLDGVDVPAPCPA